MPYFLPVLGFVFLAVPGIWRLLEFVTACYGGKLTPVRRLLIPLPLLLLLGHNYARLLSLPSQYDPRRYPLPPLDPRYPSEGPLATGLILAALLLMAVMPWFLRGRSCLTVEFVRLVLAVWAISGLWLVVAAVTWVSTGGPVMD